jgi:hypothetical protein
VTGRRAGRAAAALAAILLAAPAAGVQPFEAALAQGPAGLLARLEKDGVVVAEDAAARMLVAYVVFARARRSVVDLIVQPGRQLEYRPELTSAEVVEEDANERVDEHHMTILFTDVAYRLRYRRDPDTDRIDWSLDPSFENDLARLDGFWEFFDLPDGRTLGRFGSRVDVGPALPAFVQERISRQTVIRTVENCRRWVDSGGTWRP